MSISRLPGSLQKFLYWMNVSLTILLKIRIYWVHMSWKPECYWQTGKRGAATMENMRKIINIHAGRPALELKHSSFTIRGQLFMW